MRGIWDKIEYMNTVNWPEKTLKKGCKIEMCFSYPEADEESRVMWCCGDVTRVGNRDGEVVRMNIKLDKDFVACGESVEDEQLLKKHLWNPETPRKGAWRQDMREFLKKTK